MTSPVAARYGISLADNGSPVGLAVDALVEPALRRNPRRAQLLVSTVLGKHVPVDPRVAAGAGRLLGALVDRRLTEDHAPVPNAWSKAAAAAVTDADPAALLRLLDGQSTSGRLTSRPAARDHGDVLTIGFAETATALGHLVADQLGSGYLHSTRRRSGAVPVAAEFSETHSHATAHLLRPASPDLLSSADTVVLVDDELSTGRTALNVIEVLQAIRPRRRYVLAGLVDVRSADADAERAAVAERLGCPIEVVSLVRGSVWVPPDAVQRVAADLGAEHGISENASGRTGVDQVDPVPPAASNRLASGEVVSIDWPGTVPAGGTFGFLPDQGAAFASAVDAVADRLRAELGEARRLLVIGTEEFMYLPLRVALALVDASGPAVAFQSTTRSPVHVLDEPGYPIRRRILFRASVDGGKGTARRFLYNASWPSEPPGSGGANGEPDLVLVLDDDGSALNGPAGVAAAVAAANGARVVLAAIGSDSRR